VQEHYDYIIAGAGAAGLTLAWKLLQSSLENKKVLIVDNNLDPENDKTWCFWESGSPPFADIIYQKWNNAEVCTSRGRFSQSLKEYTYYCLRSIDFENKILDTLQAHPDFDLLETEITGFESSSKEATLQSGTESFDADYIFQSCFNP
jgi:lycopene beta-cyclase